MIKNAKLSAKKLILNKYKYLFIPSTIVMILNAIAYLFINVIITYMNWVDFSHFLQIIFLLCFIGLEFVCIPLSSVLLYKTIFNLDNANNTVFSIKQTLSSDIIIRTVKVNLIPVFLRILVKTCPSKVFYYNRNYLSVAIISSWVGIFISYKFLAANYFIALGDEHPIKKSFELTKKIFGEYLLLGLSFLGYVMLGAGIGVLLQYLITGSPAYNLYLPQLQIFNSFGYGVGFFLTPYIFTTEYFWFKQKESNLRQI